MISAQTLEKLDQAGIACFIKKADGRYSFINQSGAEMLGLKPSEVIDRDDFELFSVKSAVEIMKRDYDVLAEDELTEYFSEAQFAGRNETQKFHSLKRGFWHPEGIGGGLIGISIADEEPTEEQVKLLELMKVILSEAASEVVAQIELLNTNPTLH